LNENGCECIEEKYIKFVEFDEEFDEEFVPKFAKFRFVLFPIGILSRLIAALSIGIVGI
jgi:hypothetical protein